MRRRTRRRQEEDHTGIAFVSAVMLGIAMVAVVEDVRYSATGVPLWSTWHFHPLSIFIGVLSFVGLLYFLHRMDSRLHANDYVGPYLPLVVLAGANLVLRLNPAWLIPVALACTAWSLGRIRRVRAQRSLSRRA